MAPGTRAELGSKLPVFSCAEPPKSGTGTRRCGQKLDLQQVNARVRYLDLDVERVAQRGQRGREVAGCDRQSRGISR